jgi:hypothetical protein
MGVDELLTVAVDFCGQPISVIGQACSEILIYEFTPRHLFCQRTTSITGTEETMLTSSRTAPTSPVHAKVRWGSARPPRQPSELDATYHIAHGTPIIFCSLPSGIVQHRPLRPRTIFALDIATARPPEVRANVGATNKSSVPLQIAAHRCHKPLAMASPCETGSNLARQRSHAKPVSQERYGKKMYGKKIGTLREDVGNASDVFVIHLFVCLMIRLRAQHRGTSGTLDSQPRTNRQHDHPATTAPLRVRKRVRSENAGQNYLH